MLESFAGGNIHDCECRRALVVLEMLTVSFLLLSPYFLSIRNDHSLSIRDGKVVLARSNPRDHFQHWIKKEVDGGGFTLFNKGTAQAIKRSPNISPVNKKVIELLLISMPFNSLPDPDALWIEKKEGEKGFAIVFGKQGDKQGYRLQPHS